MFTDALSGTSGSNVSPLGHGEDNMLMFVLSLTDFRNVSPLSLVSIGSPFLISSTVNSFGTM